MAREPYEEDIGPSEFTGSGQGPVGDIPGVGILPPGAGQDLVSWYHTNPADPSSAPEEGNTNIGDDRILRNRPRR